MLIIDEAKARELARQKVIEKTREVTLGGAENEARDAHMVVDPHKSVANVARQTGRKFTPQEFMKKLNTLNPDLRLDPHPGFMVPKHISRDKGVMSLVIGGLKTMLFVCEYDWLPEWSIMTTKTIRVPRSNPDEPWQEVKIPHFEEKRGWREVLLMLAHKGLIGPEATERVFGAGDRPSWRVLMGKGTGSIF